MTNRKLKINKHTIAMLALFCSVLILLSACRKTEYNIVQNPAYLRVFNSLNYPDDITTKDLPPPFLAMVIDPQYDASGLITGGDVLGDFIDKRSPYAPPYPDKAGSTSYKNTEYPGSAKVQVAPIVNGIDLSSWAQIKSGKHRIVFYSRPVNPTPFFSLEARDRKILLADSTINIVPGEIYTMEILQKNVNHVGALAAGLYIRQEQFTKQAFSDSLLYVNFYNLSAEGYAAANPGAITSSNYYLNISNKAAATGDVMNIYYTLVTDDVGYPYVRGSKIGLTLIPGYNNIWLGTLRRSFTSGVAAYNAIPMFAGADNTNRILSKQWELFTLLAPGRTPIAGPVAVGIDAPTGMQGANATFGAIGCGNVSNDGKGVTTGGVSIPRSGLPAKLMASYWLPNLIKYTASGSYAQRSFATISSIEIINDQIYMMSVQRSYPKPNN